jgi:hypothetical protein
MTVLMTIYGCIHTALYGCFASIHPYMTSTRPRCAGTVLLYSRWWPALAIWLNLGPDTPERVWEVRFPFKPGSNAEPVPIWTKMIRGIQSRCFSCDPVVVSQLFLFRFVSCETTLKRSATLNVPFHFAFVMADSQNFIYFCPPHTLFWL